jgi:uncharacterized protein YoxC
MTDTEILISLLSIVLIVLLLLLIVVVAYIIRLLRRINHISDTASRVMDDMKSASSVFKKSAAPVAVSRIISNVIDLWRDTPKKD